MNTDIDYNKKIMEFINSAFSGIIPIVSIVFISSLIYRFILLEPIFNLPISQMQYTVLINTVPTILYGVLILLYLFVFKKFNLIHNDEFEKSMLMYILVGLISLLFFNTLISLIFEILDVSVGTNTVIKAGESLDPIYYLYLVPGMILFVGPIEEVMVRGVVQGSFREHFSVNTSIFVTSFIFGLLHIISVEGFVQTITYVMSTFVLSIILGYIYEETQNIIVPSLTHGFYNASLVIGFYIIETGII